MRKRVKNASNKLSLPAPPVFQRLLHPRRFKVMREKQIAVITLLDVKTELPRYPPFGLGIGNISPPPTPRAPTLKTFLFLGGK